MDFGWPNAKIGWKMSSGQLLFLALKVHDSILENLKYVLNSLPLARVCTTYIRKLFVCKIITQYLVMKLSGA